MPKVKEAFKADNATTATNLDSAPVFSRSNDAIKIQVGGKTSATFTVPFATKAAQDESGNNIKESYGSTLAISGLHVTLESKSGATLSTITIPSNTSTEAGVVPAPGSSNTYKI